MTKFVSPRALSLAFAALGLFAVQTPAFAQPEDGAVQMTVSYTDLDISHPAGAKVLLGRIQQASLNACGGNPSGGWQLRQRPEMEAFNQCRSQAIAEAVISIHSPMLDAMVSGTAKSERLASR